MASIAPPYHTFAGAVPKLLNTVELWLRLPHHIARVLFLKQSTEWHHATGSKVNGSGYHRTLESCLCFDRVWSWTSVTFPEVVPHTGACAKYAALLAYLLTCSNLNRGSDRTETLHSLTATSGKPDRSLTRSFAIFGFAIFGLAKTKPDRCVLVIWTAPVILRNIRAGPFTFANQETFWSARCTSFQKTWFIEYVIVFWIYRTLP